MPEYVIQPGQAGSKFRTTQPIDATYETIRGYVQLYCWPSVVDSDALISVGQTVEEAADAMRKRIAEEYESALRLNQFERGNLTIGQQVYESQLARLLTAV